MAVAAGPQSPYSVHISAWGDAAHDQYPHAPSGPQSAPSPPRVLAQQYATLCPRAHVNPVGCPGATLTCEPFLEAVLHAMHLVGELQYAKPVNVVGITLVKGVHHLSNRPCWDMLFARSGNDSMYKENFAALQHKKLLTMLSNRISTGLQRAAQDAATSAITNLVGLNTLKWSALMMDAPADATAPLATAIHQLYTCGWWDPVIQPGHSDLTTTAGCTALVERIRRSDPLDANIRASLRQWLGKQTTATAEAQAVQSWITTELGPAANGFPHMQIIRAYYSKAVRNKYVQQVHARKTTPGARYSVLAAGDQQQMAPGVTFRSERVSADKGGDDFEGDSGNFRRVFRGGHSDKGVIVCVCAGAKLAAELARRIDEDVRRNPPGPGFVPTRHMHVFGEAALKGDAFPKKDKQGNFKRVEGIYVSRENKPAGEDPRDEYRSEKQANGHFRVPLIPSCTSCQYQIVDMLDPDFYGPRLAAPGVAASPVAPLPAGAAAAAAGASSSSSASALVLPLSRAPSPQQGSTVAAAAASPPPHAPMHAHAASER